MIQYDINNPFKKPKLEDNMLSTKLNAQLLLGVLTIALNSSAFAQDVKPASPAQTKTQSKEIPYNLHDEADKTDIFAIPSDSSEEEQEEEMNELKELEQKQSLRSGRTAQ